MVHYDMHGAQVLHIFDIVRSYFPDANVFASTFDAYTEQLLAKKSQLDLPVVYGEIGDTWIYGGHVCRCQCCILHCLLTNSDVLHLLLRAHEVRNKQELISNFW